MSFYMTLPSDSSRDIFADNRIGNFTTSLAREVVLEKDYEVGLSECFLPNPRSQIKEPIMYSTDSGGTYNKFELDVGTLASLVEGEEVSIKVPKVEDTVPVFKFTVKEKKLVIHVAPSCSVRFTVENTVLARILGFGLTTLKGFEGQPAKILRHYLMNIP